LIASTLAQYFRLKSGGEVRLFANYDLVNSTPFRHVDQWIEVAQARGSIMLWDEAQTQFDRRTWSRNTFLTQLFNMTRKLRCVHFFMNPIGNNLDGRILALVEIFVEVRKRPNQYIELLLYEYQDKRYGPNGRFIKRLIVPWWKVKQIQSLELYDTDQMLYPFPVPSTERKETELLQRMIEAQQEAAKLEKEGVKVNELSGWINPSDRHEDREKKRSESSETRLFIS